MGVNVIPVQKLLVLYLALSSFLLLTTSITVGYLIYLSGCVYSSVERGIKIANTDVLSE